ncbi:MAG: hypothetical protein WC477_05505 [Patescibacteria group bacterium]
MLLTVSYDPDRDAENYVHSIYERAYSAHGRTDFIENLIKSIESVEIKTALKESASREEALKTITTLLTQQYKNSSDDLDKKAKKLEEEWKRIGTQIEWQLAFLYQKPFLFEAIHVDLTSIPICPYHFNERRIFIYTKEPVGIQLSILMHELNHFMFYQYYQQLLKKLGKENFELLKESLTLFTNPEQMGKPHEQPLRDLFLSKTYNNLHEAIEDGALFLTNNSKK